MTNPVTREPTAKAGRVEIDLTGGPDGEAITPSTSVVVDAVPVQLVINYIYQENETHYHIAWEGGPNGRRYKDTWEPKCIASTEDVESWEERKARWARDAARARSVTARARSVTPGEYLSRLNQI